MKQFTRAQMKQAEEFAIELGFENVKTPVDALGALALCLLAVDQQKKRPEFTGQEFEEAGTFMLLNYTLGPNFPYTNQQIIDYIKEIKKQPPPVWDTPPIWKT